VEPFEQPFLGLAGEVDDHVSADDHVHPPAGAGSLEQITRFEGDEVPDFGGNGAHAVLHREILFDYRRERISESIRSITAFARCRDGLAIDVAPDDPDFIQALEVVDRQGVLAADNRERVWLFASCAARAPDSDERRFRAPQLGHHFGRDTRERLGVPEEFRDVDRECLDKTVVLYRIGVENAGVICESSRSLCAHSDGDAASEAGVLVTRTAKPAIPLDLATESEKSRLVSLRWRLH
jgi:hypothetical protein